MNAVLAHEERVKGYLRETFELYVKEHNVPAEFRNYNYLHKLNGDFNDLNRHLDNKFTVGVTDDKTFIAYGGTLDRAADRLWEMENEDPACKGMKLMLILVEDPAMYDADWRQEA